MPANIRVNAATEAQAYIRIIGEIKEGSTIDIVVDLENVTNLYAASIDYAYDNSLIKVEEITLSAKLDNNINEGWKETASGGNKLKYGYTNLGEIPGFSGSSNLVLIKAKVLKDGELNITNDNFELILVQNQNGIVKMPCDFHFPGESWEAVPTPAGEVTYTSIESKGSSISASRVTEIEEENKIALEAVGDGDKENTDENAPQTEGEEQVEAEAELKAEAEAEADKVAKDEEDKEEDSNYAVLGIIGLIIIAGTGFFIYKRKSLNNNNAV